MENLTESLAENITKTIDNNTLSLENETLEDTNPMHSLTLMIPFTIIYSIIFISGVIGNVSTCIVISKNRSMHTATNYYLFSLAISDMLLLVSGLPIEMYMTWSWDNYVFGEAFCVIQGFAAETSANATVLTITAFTFERYLAICHPFLSHTMSKLSRVVKFIIAIWIIALSLAIPQAIQFGVLHEVENGKNTSTCTVVHKYFEHAFEISTFLFFVGPMTLITVLYIFIGIQLRRSRNIAGKKSSVSNPNSESAKNLRNNAAQNRVVRMLVAVVAAFFICWAPFHAQRLLAVYMLNASPEVQEIGIKIYSALMYMSGVAYYLSTTVNPVLYHTMSKKFRETFKKTFTDMFCPNRRQPDRGYSMISRCGNQSTCKARSSEVTTSVVLEDESTNRQSSSSRNAKRMSLDRKLLQQRSDSRLSTKSLPGPKNNSNDKNCIANDNASAQTQPFLNNSTIPSNEKSIRVLANKMFHLFHKSNNPKETNCFRPESSGNTISNSSLKDREEEEFSSSDLIKYMQDVNTGIK